MSSPSNPLLFTQENHDLELDTQTNYPPARDSFPNPPSSTDLEHASKQSSSRPDAEEEHTKAVLALPAPPDPMSDEANQAPKLEVNRPTEGVAGGVFKFDKLGPMVVNSDGTLSRITNWQELSEGERERTVRLLVKKRNLVRLASQTPPESSNPSPSPSRPDSPSRSQDPAANPAHLPAHPTASSSSLPSAPSPYQPATIPDTLSHSALTVSSSNNTGSVDKTDADTEEQKEASQSAQGTTVDPHKTYQSATRSIEEKVVDLMKGIQGEEDEAKRGGPVGERSGAGQGEADSEEGSEVRVVSLGQTDISGVTR